mmetsp:Transcript_18176/g.40311  ORF Transcript_18176/g.40311 Transcript_18176/m.40311 type:complete len:212 (+) Transcript_18176:1421-2056(+)
MMFITQLHRPAAAEFFFSIASGLKWSSSKKGRTSFQFISGTLPSSMLLLKALSSSRKPLTLPSRAFLAASQVRSLSRTRPLFCTIMLGFTPARSTITAPKTSSTPAGGLAMVLQLPRSLRSSDSRAPLARIKAGSACSRSFAASACLIATSACITATFDSSTLALSFSFATTSLSLCTVLAMPSATARFSSADSSMIFKLASNSTTSLAAL